MDSDHLVRDVTPDDIPAFWELRLLALHDHPSAFGSDYEHSRLAGPTYAERGYFDGGVNRLFAAYTSEGEIVAQAGTYVGAGQRSHIATVISVYTHPHHRGKGLASRLVQAAIDHLRAFPEITSIRIAVNASNLAAIHTYEKLGFVTWGEEPDAIRTADGSCHNELHMVLAKGTRGL
jgi:ribosomal protein S18 acetylase RimI-like enzyme